MSARRLQCTEANLCQHRWRKEMLDARVPERPPTNRLSSPCSQNSADVMRPACTPWWHGMYRVTRRGFPEARTRGALFVHSSWCFTLQMCQKSMPSIGPRVVHCWASPVAIIHSCCSLNGYISFLQPNLATTICTRARGTWLTQWAGVCKAEEIGATVRWTHAGTAHLQINWPL